MRPFSTKTALSHLLLATAAAAWLGCAASSPSPPAPAAADAGLDARLTVDPQVHTGTLPNGLRYVIRANRKPEARAELRLVVNVGSVLEEDPEQGLAHFAEHMAFNGTEHFAKHELVDYLESIGMRFGADLNAYTSFDETVYMLTVPTDSAHVVDRAFQVLEDWAHNVSYEDEEIDKERGVVVEEWRLRRGADRRMYERQIPILLQDSRYAQRLAIGQKAVLDTFTHESLRQFYRRWYQPDLMGFVAVGDFEPARIESLATAYFGRIPAPASPTVRPEYPVPDHDATLFAIATDPEATQNAISLYYKQDVRDESTVGAYRRSLLEGLYHGMLNRRLFERTTKASPPFLGASSSQGRSLRTKEFFVLGAAVENNGFERGLHALLTEAARVRQHGFTNTELARQKQEMLRGIEQAYRERDKLESRSFAAEYVRHLLVAEPIPGIEREHELYQQLLPTIALAEVNALAQQWTSDRNRVITVNAPDKEGVGVPVEAELLATFEAVAAQAVEPYVDEGADLPLLPTEPVPGAVVARSEIPELGVAVWTLANGARVLLKPTEFKNDEILFTAFSPGGHSLVPDEHYIAAATAATVVTSGGVGNFDQVGLMKWLSGKVANARPYIAELDEGLSGSASPEDVEAMFQLVHGWFTATRADSAAFESLKTRLGAWVENRSSRPETAYEDTMAVTMAQHHFRARPWSPALLAELDLATSMAVYRERFAEAGDFTFVFVGNFTLEGIEPLVATYLASLPTAGRKESWLDVGMDPPPGVVTKVVRRGLEPKSRTRLVFTGPFVYDGWRNLFELDAMAQVLEIKLREVLREDLGGTYGVGVGASVTHYPEEGYQLTVSFGCDPTRVEELTGVVFQQLDSLRTVPADTLYLAKVKEIRRREREVDLKENGWWLGALKNAEYHHGDPRLILRYEELVAGLSAEDVRRTAAACFDTTRYARFVMLPAEDGAAGAAQGP